MKNVLLMDVIAPTDVVTDALFSNPIVTILVVVLCVAAAVVLVKVIKKKKK